MAPRSPDEATHAASPQQPEARGGERTASGSAAANAELAAILERIGDGFIAFDSALTYTYVNARAAALLGRDDLVGKNHYAEFPDARGSPFAEACEKALSTGRPLQFENYYAPWDR